MAKKCKACSAPIEGFWAKISSLAGVKKSTKNPDYCNKCEDKIGEQSTDNPVAPSIPASPEPVAEEKTTVEKVEEPSVSKDEDKQEEWAEELKEEQVDAIPVEDAPAEEVVEESVEEETPSLEATEDQGKKEQA